MKPVSIKSEESQSEVAMYRKYAPTVISLLLAQVYPRGNGRARGHFLSLFLEMVRGPKTPTKYEYRVELVASTDADKSIVREFVSDFEVCLI